MSLKKVIRKLTKKLESDPDYYRSWKANIAMAYKDVEKNYREKYGKKRLNKKDRDIVANEAAEYFLRNLINK